MRIDLVVVYYYTINKAYIRNISIHLLYYTIHVAETS